MPSNDVGVDWPDVPPDVWVLVIRKSGQRFEAMRGYKPDSIFRDKKEVHWIDRDGKFADVAFDPIVAWQSLPVSPAAAAEGVDYRAKAEAWDKLYIILQQSRNGSRNDSEKFAYGRTLNTMDELVHPSPTTEPDASTREGHQVESRRANWEIYRLRTALRTIAGAAIYNVTHGPSISSRYKEIAADALVPASPPAEPAKEPIVGTDLLYNKNADEMDQRLGD